VPLTMARALVTLPWHAGVQGIVGLPLVRVPGGVRQSPAATPPTASPSPCCHRASQPAGLSPGHPAALQSCPTSASLSISVGSTVPRPGLLALPISHGVATGARELAGSSRICFLMNTGCH